MFRYIIYSFFFLAFTVFAQMPNLDAELARAGNRVLTKSQFEKRFELTPQLGNLKKSTEQKKHLDFLYSLIAEKLWAQDAEKLGLDTVQSIKTAVIALQNMFIRDALYMQEIRDKVTLSPSELKNAINRQRKTLDVKYLFSEDSAEIAGYFTLLKAGIQFDTILSTTVYAKGQETPQKIVHGQMAEYVEDSLYNLEYQRFTNPIETEVGFYIFYLTNYTEELLVNVNDPEDKIVKQATIIAKKRKETKLFQEYYQRFFTGKSIDVKAVPLKSLAVHLSTVLQNKKKLQKIDNQTPVKIEISDALYLLESIPADTLQTTFAIIEGRKFTMRDYLLLTVFEGFKTKDVALTDVFAFLSGKTRRFVESEILAAEGKRLQLDKSPSVIEDMQVWKDNYLYSLNRNRFLDSVMVTEAEIKEYYKNNFKELNYPQQVNIIEILSENLETINGILQQIKTGADFAELAKIHNKRSWTQKSNGEYGFFPVFMHGAIGQIAAKLEVGEVFGPIQTEDGYSVIKCIGKKAEYVEYPSKSYEQMRDVIERKLKSEQLKGKLEQYTARLAKEIGFTINAKALQSIETSNINSFAIRHLGFGGQLPGVPILAPDNDWVDEYYKTINPQP